MPIKVNIWSKFLEVIKNQKVNLDVLVNTVLEIPIEPLNKKDVNKRQERRKEWLKKNQDKNQDRGRSYKRKGEEQGEDAMTG